MNKELLILGLVGEMAHSPVSMEPFLTLAELKTVDTNGFIKTIETNTAIVSLQLVDKIKPGYCNPFVETTGPYRKGRDVYRPDFWLYLSPASGLQRVQPLVVVWSTGNHTTMQPDQGFVSALGLTPKLLNEEICWDDLSRPRYKVIRNRPMAFYDFPHYTPAYVKVDREYLADYLNLRQKTAVQVFSITEDLPISADLEALLNGQDHYIQTFEMYEVQFKRNPHLPEMIRLEINGYRLLLSEAANETMPVEPAGHYWKGVNGIVSGYRARHELGLTYAYVHDEVLALYEHDEAYEVFPRSGSVKYGIHWAVGHCERFGRNAIKVELKKLYEGTPYEVIDHWNKFSVDPANINLSDENIEVKARRLCKRFFLFSRLLATLGDTLTGITFYAMDLIGLDEKRIEHTGWQEFPDYYEIAKHVNDTAFNREHFIARCKKLYILLGENLNEKSLRKLINQLGFPLKDTEKLRTLKLLELLLKYVYVADESGLHLVNSREAILERIAELKTYEPIPELMALNALRQLDAHKTSDFKQKLNMALRTFGIDPNALSGNYAHAIDQVYDRLATRLESLNSWMNSF
jgi:hypothetical protein